MYVKSIIFLSVLIFGANSLRAGVISASWLDQGCGSVEMGKLDASPEEPLPSDRDQNRQEGLFCSASSGMSSVAIAGHGASVSSFVVAGMNSSQLPEPEIQGTLRCDNDLLSPSPILSGLLKPS